MIQRNGKTHKLNKNLSIVAHISMPPALIYNVILKKHNFRGEAF